jgi:hypothetical protein
VTLAISKGFDMTKSYWDYTGQGESYTHLKPDMEARIRWVAEMAERLVKAGNNKAKLRAIAKEYDAHNMLRTAQGIRIKHHL